MKPLLIHDFHTGMNAEFQALNGMEVVAQYGSVSEEYQALRTSAGVFDFSPRGRVCVTGADRQRFLHGQVTNDVKRLPVGGGCYAALVTAKGKMVSDLNIFQLAEELLLDFEPGFTEKVEQRLNQYIIADDVQIVDAAPYYGLLSVQGPNAAAVLEHALVGIALPAERFQVLSKVDPVFGSTYLVNHPRLAMPGYDWFIPAETFEQAARTMQSSVLAARGRFCGWKALELARVEAGIPRFGVDMDETNLPPEAGLEARAISYSKGCYIGQEVIARIRTYGQVAKALRGLRLASDLPALPGRGTPLWHNGVEVGVITSAVTSLRFHANLALAYVRREVNAPGTKLTLRVGPSESLATITSLPFEENFA